MTNSTNTKNEAEWRAVLTPQQFRVIREKGTELAGTGKYNKFNKTGVYNCAACDTPLYTSKTKFNSGSGWPAFYDAIPEAVTRTKDDWRTEITCTACGGHLGHVFEGEGFNTPTDERHCVNSISLNFSPKEKVKKSKSKEVSNLEDESAEKEGVLNGNMTALYALPERIVRSIASFLRLRSP